MHRSSKVALAVLVGSLATTRAAYPCDTWVALPDVTSNGFTILAKNSDRPVFDCQPLVFFPRQKWPEGATIDVGRLAIPQVSETFATIGSSPYWCWGYEEGMNEFGVAIGNEGIRTKQLTLDLMADAEADGPPPGPTGMDLLRLGLERSRTAQEAISVITLLLESYGQFGSGLPTMDASEGAYENSFIIADPSEAWVLETSGRNWVARRIESGSTSISNTPSIGAQWDLASQGLVTHAVANGWWPGADASALDFTAAYADDSPLGVAQRAQSIPRAACSSRLVSERHGSVDPRWMMRIARDESSSPPINLDRTASSCVAILPDSDDTLPVFWWAPAVPGDSCFVPFFVHGSELPAIVSRAGTSGSAVRPPSEVAADEFDENSYWWIFRRLHDAASASATDHTPEIRATFDALEAEFESGLGDVIEEAAMLRKTGRPGEAARVLDAYSADCVARAVVTANELHEAIVNSASEETPPELEPYVGAYDATFREETHIVVVRGGKLAIEIPQQGVVELLDPDGSGRRQFAMTDQVSVSFIEDDEGGVIGMTYHQGPMDLELLRADHAPPAEVDPDRVRGLIGAYRADSVNLDAAVIVRHGRLAVDVKGQIIFVLRWSENEDKWIARATDLITVAFEMDETGAATSMTMFRAGQPVVFERQASDNTDTTD